MVTKIYKSFSELAELKSRVLKNDKQVQVSEVISSAEISVQNVRESITQLKSKLEQIANGVKDASHSEERESRDSQE